MADTDLAPNGGAATPDPAFTTRADLEAWAAKEARKPKTAMGMLKALDLIRRVTLAHVHLGEG
jgi:hypothetical protein